MSNVVKKQEKPKRVKIQEPEPEVDFTASEIQPKKVRKSRAKPKPTREDMLQLLLENQKNVKQMIDNMKEEEMKIQHMGLKKVAELVQGELEYLEEDLERLEEKYKEILALPVEQPAN